MTEDDRLGTLSCEAVRDRLPDLAAGRLSDDMAAAVSEHVDTCRECAAQAAVVAALRRERPSAPDDLAGRIQAAVRGRVGSDRQATPQPGQERSRTEPGPVPSGSGDGAPVRPASASWLTRAALPAAAILAAVLGGALFWQAELADDPSPWGLDEIDDVSGEPVPWLFPSDDGVLAGAPVLEGLSDDALARLIEEMEG